MNANYKNKTKLALKLKNLISWNIQLDADSFWWLIYVAGGADTRLPSGACVGNVNFGVNVNGVWGDGDVVTNVVVIVGIGVVVVREYDDKTSFVISHKFASSLSSLDKFVLEKFCCIELCKAFKK